MQNERQVIRWAIPGWLLLSTILFFHVLTLLFLGFRLTDLLSLPFLERLTIAIAALLVASGIPLGFVAYQIYHATVGVYLFGIISRDRGYEVFKDLPEHIRDKLVKDTGSNINPSSTSETNYKSDFSVVWRTKRVPFLPNAVYILDEKHKRTLTRRQYRKRMQVNWALATSYLDYICSETKSSTLKSEYTTLSDIYHALGAARTSILLALAAYHSYILVFHPERWLNNPIRMLLAISTTLLITASIIWFFEINRRSSQLRLILTLRHAFHLYTTKVEQQKLKDKTYLAELLTAETPQPDKATPDGSPVPKANKD